jgi:hypothetical protein
MTDDNYIKVRLCAAADRRAICFEVPPGGVLQIYGL